MFLVCLCLLTTEYAIIALLSILIIHGHFKIYKKLLNRGDLASVKTNVEKTVKKLM